MRVRVTANLTIGYGGEYHGKGAEFSVLPDDLAQIRDLVEVLEEIEDEEDIEEDIEEVNAPEMMTVAQLKTKLDDKGISYPKTAKKDDLIALLVE